MEVDLATRRAGRLEVLAGVVAGLGDADWLFDVVWDATNRTVARDAVQRRYDVTPTGAEAPLSATLVRFTRSDRHWIEAEWRFLNDEPAEPEQAFGDAWRAHNHYVADLRSRHPMPEDPDTGTSRARYAWIAAREGVARDRERARAVFAVVRSAEDPAAAVDATVRTFGISPSGAIGLLHTQIAHFCARGRQEALDDAAARRADGAVLPKWSWST